MSDEASRPEQEIETSQMHYVLPVRAAHRDDSDAESFYPRCRNTRTI
jgi:hypothetical protein